MSDNHISMCKLLGVQQSMSRRGNCLDNAPIESFFGHMKDEINFKDILQKCICFYFRVNHTYSVRCPSRCDYFNVNKISL